MTESPHLRYCIECPEMAAQTIDSLTEALQKVRQELWVDYCLAHNTTQPNPDPFKSRPVIRIIDEALS